MFRRLRAWWHNRGRAIFEYWDGTAWRAADPLVIWRALREHPRFNWDETPKLVDAEDSEALQLTVATVREVFALPLFGSGGLTEGECLRLLIEFTEYLDQQKKSGDSPQTSPEPTGLPSSAG